MFTTPRRRAVPLDDARAVAGLGGQEVRRAQDPLLLVEVLVDLAVAVGVVAERDHVDAGGEDLLARHLRRDADAARRVLAVDDRRTSTAWRSLQRGEQRGERPAAEPARPRRRRRGSSRLAAASDTHAETMTLAPESPTPDAPPGAERAGGGASRRACTCAPVVVPRWVQLVLLPLRARPLRARARRRASSCSSSSSPRSSRSCSARSSSSSSARRAPRAVRRPRLPDAASRPSPGVDRPAHQPGLHPGRVLPERRAAPRRPGQRSLANLQNYLDDHGINVHVKKQGQTALETLQKNVLKRSGAIVYFTRDLLQHDRHRRLRADPHPRDLDLHAALRRATSGA